MPYNLTLNPLVSPIKGSNFICNGGVGTASLYYLYTMPYWSVDFEADKQRHLLAEVNISRPIGACQIM